MVINKQGQLCEKKCISLLQKGYYQVIHGIELNNLTDHVIDVALERTGTFYFNDQILNKLKAK